MLSGRFYIILLKCYNKKVYYAYLIILLLIQQKTFCQYNEKDFIFHNRKNGLSNNYITSLAQDETGYIWASTMKGLTRYDGSTFFPVYLQQFKCFEDYGSILRMKYFGHYQMGITSGAGGYIFNTLTLQWQQLAAVPTFGDFYTFNKCRDIERIDDGTYATSTSTGFYIFDKQGKLISRKDGIAEKETGKKWFQFGGVMHRLSDGTIIQENSDNYYIRQASSKQITPFLNTAAGANYNKKIINSNERGVKNHFWINKTNTVFILNRQNNTLDIIKKFSDGNITSSLTLPFDIKTETSWQSEIFFLTDTTFAINLLTKGFYHFKYNPLNGTAVADKQRYFKQDFCTAIIQDKANNLWIGTDKGLYQQKKTPLLFKTYSLKPYLQQNISRNISAIHYAAGKIFVGTRQQSDLLILNAADKKVLSKINLQSIDPLCNNINGIYPFNKDTLWLCTDKGLVWFNIKNNRFAKLDSYGYPAALNSGINSFCFTDSRKNAWFRTNKYNTVFYYDAGKKKFVLVNEETAGPEFKIALCFGIGEDADGKIWFGGDGLCRWDYTTGMCDSVIEKLSAIPTNNLGVNIFFTDWQKNIWLGTTAGIYKWDAAKGKGQLFTINNGLPDNINFSQPADENHFFIHTNDGLVFFDNRTNAMTIFNVNDGLPEPNIQSKIGYAFNPMANEYLFGYGQLLVALTANFKPINVQPVSLNINSVAVLQDTILYHPSDKIILNNNQNDLAIQFNTINFNDPGNQVFAYRLLKKKDSTWIMTGSQNTIYLNDIASGTYRLQVKVMAANKRWQPLIKELYIIIKNPFWKTWWFILSTAAFITACMFLILKWRDKSLQKANTEKLQLQYLKTEKLTHQLEMEKITNYFTSSVADKNNVTDILWDVASNLIGRLGFADCMIYLWNDDKTKLVQKAGYGPKGSIEEILRLPFDVSPGQGVVGYVAQTKTPLIIPDTTIDSRYRQDELFRLSEICVPIIYNDELIGIIDSEHPEKNFFTQRHLQIMGTIATLVGNKIKSIEIETGLQQHKLELSMLNKQLTEFEIKALHAQMNPHFIFNALNSIKDMILMDEKENASRYLSKFAHLIRLNLEHSRQSAVTLQQNADYLHAYLAMEQLRFTDFIYTIKILNIENTHEVKIPPMLIQPIVENAIWHGLLPKQGEKKVTIEFSCNEEYLFCRIEDNGIGLLQSEKNKTLLHQQHHSLGMQNIYDRIEAMNKKYKLQSSFKIMDKSALPDTNGSGTIAILVLPLMMYVPDNIN
jgi:ligand-binding sensor domain-containing protein/putative methionine-R-sulfoxide reductase with GAF domain